MKLYAPKTYWEATEEERNAVCNGCGAKGGMNVPDTMYFLCVTQACNVHDWMWKEGKTFADFLFSNAVFIMNLVILITSYGSKWLAPLRLARATKYFLAVQTLGEENYWVDCKVKNDEMYITYKGEFRCVDL